MSPVGGLVKAFSSFYLFFGACMMCIFTQLIRKRENSASTRVTHNRSTVQIDELSMSNEARVIVFKSSVHVIEAGLFLDSWVGCRLELEVVERLGFWRVERLGSVRKVPSAYLLSKVGTVT